MVWFTRPNSAPAIPDAPPSAVVLIPPGVRQRITNTGDADLIFLAVCTPRFTLAGYEDVEPA